MNGSRPLPSRWRRGPRSRLPIRLTTLAGAIWVAACATVLPPPTAPGAADLYRAELARRPEGRRAERLREALEQADLAAARKHHTVLAYRAFLSEFPTGPRAQEARALLDGVRWTEAAKQGTAAALRGYLDDEPAGAHVAEARSLLAEQVVQAALQRGDAPALRAWLRDNPDSPDRQRASLALEKVDFEQALEADLPRKTRLFEAWAADHAASPLRPQVLELIRQAGVEEAVLLEDAVQLRALARGPLSALATNEAEKLELELASAQLDARRLAELAGLPPQAPAPVRAAPVAPAAKAGRKVAAPAPPPSASPPAVPGAGPAHSSTLRHGAQALLDQLLASSPSDRAEVEAAARTLFRPAAPGGELPALVVERARALAGLGRSSAAGALPALLGALSDRAPWTALAALDAAVELLAGLPRGLRVLVSEQQRERLGPIARDAARVVSLSLLSRATGDPSSALALSRAAVGQEPASPVALLAAARLELELGDQALAPEAIRALASRARAMAAEHAAAQPPASPADQAPALWSVCAAAVLAEESLALARRLAAAEAGPAVELASRAVAEVQRSVEAVERRSSRPDACAVERGQRSSLARADLEVRLAAVARLRRAGPVAAVALARAALRDPVEAVRSAARAGPERGGR